MTVLTPQHDAEGPPRDPTSLETATNDPEDVASHLLIERLDKDLYRSLGLRKPFQQARAVYGGQLIGQSLLVGLRSVDEQFSAHSLHCYFLESGNPEVPAVYHVDRLRDGRSFCTRNVVARQGGKAVFSMQASFQRPEDSRLAHQVQMPEVPPPMECVTFAEAALAKMDEAKAAGDTHTAVVMRAAASFRTTWPFEMRYVDGDDALTVTPYKRGPSKPRVRWWFRSKKLLPDAQWLHQCVAAYISDCNLALSAVGPLGYPDVHYKLIASLDHSLWFHCPFRADEWMLADYKCDRAAGARGTSTGHIYRQSGELAMTVAQEAIYRLQDSALLPKRVAENDGAPPAKPAAKL
eukprot:Rhum_TRINITY_DN14390_c15_g2::Rhum_TRINITY_DN14390_c15_g2_i1::g.85773::m.85773/K11992/ACOT8, PTE; acyl-CoA thioesterase 8